MTRSVTTVYVELLDEGTQVWRPVLAVVNGDDTYTLLPTESKATSEEQWQFGPNTIVRCERREESLYAVAKVSEVESK